MVVFQNLQTPQNSLMSSLEQSKLVIHQLIGHRSLSADVHTNPLVLLKFRDSFYSIIFAASTHTKLIQ